MTDEIKKAAPGQKKTRWKAPLAGILIIFILGVGLGFYIWEYRGQQAPDYKQMLGQVSNYIATIEHKNRGLTQRLSELSSELEAAKLETAKTPDENARQVTGLNDRLLVLEGESASLRSANAALMEENRILKERLGALQSECDALRSRVTDTPAAPDLPAPAE